MIRSVMCINWKKSCLLKPKTLSSKKTKLPILSSRWSMHMNVMIVLVLFQDVWKPNIYWTMLNSVRVNSMSLVLNARSLFLYFVITPSTARLQSALCHFVPWSNWCGLIHCYQFKSKRYPDDAESLQRFLFQIKLAVLNYF